MSFLNANGFLKIGAGVPDMYLREDGQKMAHFNQLPLLWRCPSRAGNKVRVIVKDK